MVGALDVDVLRRSVFEFSVWLMKMEGLFLRQDTSMDANYQEFFLSANLDDVICAWCATGHWKKNDWQVDSGDCKYNNCLMADMVYKALIHRNIHL